MKNSMSVKERNLDYIHCISDMHRYISVNSFNGIIYLMLLEYLSTNLDSIIRKYAIGIKDKEELQIFVDNYKQIKLSSITNESIIRVICILFNSYKKKYPENDMILEACLKLDDGNLKKDFKIADMLFKDDKTMELLIQDIKIVDYTKIENIRTFLECLSYEERANYFQGLVNSDFYFRSLYEQLLDVKDNDKCLNYYQSFNFRYFPSFIINQKKGKYIKYSTSETLLIDFIISFILGKKTIFKEDVIDSLNVKYDSILFKIENINKDINIFKLLLDKLNDNGKMVVTITDVAILKNSNYAEFREYLLKNCLKSVIKIKLLNEDLYVLYIDKNMKKDDKHSLIIQNNLFKSNLSKIINAIINQTDVDGFSYNISKELLSSKNFILDPDYIAEIFSANDKELDKEVTIEELDEKLEECYEKLIEVLRNDRG